MIGKITIPMVINFSLVDIHDLIKTNKNIFVTLAAQNVEITNRAILRVISFEITKCENSA